MESSSHGTDEAILIDLADRLSAARLARNLTQAQLARSAGISKRTRERMEAGKSAQVTSLIRVLRALDLLDAFAQLLPPPQPGPVELLRRAGKPPERASGTAQPPSKPWTWAE
jgi:transcriptional regulator with XRE-family HTH domain